MNELLENLKIESILILAKIRAGWKIIHGGKFSQFADEKFALEWICILQKREKKSQIDFKGLAIYLRAQASWSSRQVLSY